jgi:chemotaxis response regulator CheB
VAARPVVLVIDDDPAMRDLLSSRFASHGGFRIGGIAANGFEGAMLAADLAPDLVVLDQSMPRWDGPQAARFIRARCPSTHIVAFSEAYADRPLWADSILKKSEVDQLVDLAASICGLP